MKTVFVLHGGVTGKDDPMNDLFYRTYTEYTPKDEVRILMCYFAREKERWGELLERDRSNIEKQTAKKVQLTLANDPADLLNKLSSHDVLYVAGGDAFRIEPLYPMLTPLKEKLINKVYIGSSMGAFTVSKNYVLSFDSQRSGEVHKGLGLLPVNTLCHWNIENKRQEKIALLKAADPIIPVLLLNECQFSVFVG